MIFEHDGAPFTSKELAALLSGGSSKELASEETTGRFGTGFLVTHVLADKTSLDGLLSVAKGCERFRLDLDRSGDEDAILKNINDCNKAIENAEPLANADGFWSARFQYLIEDERALRAGIEAFRSALPYLYGTRPRLGEVQLSIAAGATVTWVPEATIRTALPSGNFEDRLIHERSDRGGIDYRILRFAVGDASNEAALVLLKRTDDTWEVILPTPSAPRIYTQYPLRGSGFLPIGFIFDGSFDPDQDRTRALMNDADKERLSRAFGGALVATSYACDQGWTNAHLLAQAAVPMSGFVAEDREELSWWVAQLRGFAESAAKLPLVRTTQGYVPAAISPNRPSADFIVPRLFDNSTTSETTVARMWHLLDGATELYPPIEELASDWSGIADGWYGLGLELNRITVQVLTTHVRQGASKIGDLRLRGRPYEWLSNCIDVVGECWESRSGIDLSVLKGLLPDQYGSLNAPERLRRDANIPEELKSICDSVEFDLRATLLSNELTLAIANLSLRYAPAALVEAVPETLDADDAINQLIEYLRSKLPAGMEASDANESAQGGTVLLLDYLWMTCGTGAAQVAQRVPLMAANGKCVYWSSDRVMMAPVTAWNEVAREFRDAYPLARVLSGIYGATNSSVVSALDAWGIAHPDPIIKSTPHELEGKRLACMVLDSFDSRGVVVRGEEFSQIALLQPEVLNHIQGPTEARALLGLVLCHVARNDPSWRIHREVIGSRSREIISVPIRGALWLGDLRSFPWIPLQSEDDKVIKVPAEAATLKPLLDAVWLADNNDAIELLTECFGFDELEVRLLSVAPDVLGPLRQGLARLLEAGGAKPELYESLAQEVEARERQARDVNRCRRMGLAVQEAVKFALESYGLDLKLVDHGFDYEVAVPTTSDEPLADAAVAFDVGPYFVEVKATTSGAARLTPAQARTASSESAKYVLCVVDLRGIPDERLDAPWAAVDVESLASMVSHIGLRVSDTWVLVQQARESLVGIRNETTLRYEVPTQVWESGISIRDWVASIAKSAPKH
jgi:hypothetical protein